MEVNSAKYLTVSAVENVLKNGRIFHPEYTKNSSNF